MIIIVNNNDTADYKNNEVEKNKKKIFDRGMYFIERTINDGKKNHDLLHIKFDSINSNLPFIKQQIATYKLF